MSSLAFIYKWSRVCFVHLQHVAASSGMARGDLAMLRSILGGVPEIKFICLDVANGYSEHFVEFVKEVRTEFPSHTIMVSGITTVKYFYRER